MQGSITNSSSSTHNHSSIATVTQHTPTSGPKYSSLATVLPQLSQNTQPFHQIQDGLRQLGIIMSEHGTKYEEFYPVSTILHKSILEGDDDM